MSKFKKNSGISPWNLSEIEFYNSRNKMPGFIEKIWWMQAQVTSSKEKLQSNWFSFKKPMHIHTSKRQVLSLCLYITNRRNFHVQERKKKVPYSWWKLTSSVKSCQSCTWDCKTFHWDSITSTWKANSMKNDKVIFIWIAKVKET